MRSQAYPARAESAIPTGPFVVIYARQSDPGKKAVEGEEDTTSIQVQVEDCRAMAARDYPGLPVVEFSEQFTSEVFMDRPEFARMLKTVQRAEGRCRAVYFWRYSRASRTADDRAVCNSLILAAGARILSPNDQEITSDPTTKMVAYIKATMDQIDKRTILENTMRAKRRLIEGGKLVGNGTARYGYRYEDHRRVIDPGKAEVVRRIFAEVATRSVKVVCEGLKKDGIPSPRGLANWTPAAIKQMVKDRSYFGEPFSTGKKEIVEGRWTNGQKKTRQTTPDQWSAVGEATPPIVSREVWDEANRALTSRHRKGTRQTVRHESWLRDAIVCPYCQNPSTGRFRSMSIYPTRQGTHLLRCTAGSERSGVCPNINFPLAEVEAAVWAALRYHLSAPDTLRRLIEAELSRDEGIDWQGRAAENAARLATVKKQVGKLMARFASVDDPVIEDALNAEVDRLGKESEMLRGEAEELARLMAASQASQAITREAMTMIGDAASLLGDDVTDADRKRLVVSLGLRVACYHGDQIPDRYTFDTTMAGARHWAYGAGGSVHTAEISPARAIGRRKTQASRYVRVALFSNRILASHSSTATHLAIPSITLPEC